MENNFGLKMIFLAAGSLILSGCSPQIMSEFDGNRAMEETAALVEIRPRDAGTEQAKVAAEHLLARLSASGVMAKIDTFSEETPAGPMTFHNVVGRIPGKTNRLIILGSHFDTKSGIGADFQGANDSGSSCGALMELARVLAEEGPFETEFMIAFFDGEEARGEYGPTDGLHGSRHLAQLIQESGGVPMVDAMILMDMIGDRDLKITVPRNCSPELVKELFAAARGLGLRAKFSLGKGAILDDHVPFGLAGIPVLDLIDFDYGSEPGKHDYWHTMEDTMDKLSVESLQAVGDVVLQMVRSMQ